ncbi:Membrane-bound protease [uncultured archaeon]|nr:Membrane-bound protease [uncultured archaeon]
MRRARRPRERRPSTCKEKGDEGEMSASRSGLTGATCAVRLSLLLLLTLLLQPLYAVSATDNASDGSVLVVELNDAITPASDDMVAAALQEALVSNSPALIIILDTPGGGLAETTEILRHIEMAKLPVIGYVYPEGASAWSAGTIILLGCDVAAMAPHSIIGSAQPVRLSLTGESEPLSDNKTTNAIVALVEEKARMHGRNTTASREFVISNLNLNAEDARNYSVIEYIAGSPEDLLVQIDGMHVKNTTLLTAGRGVVYFDPPLSLQLQKLLSDPTLAGLLMLVGLYALIFGLSSPGIGAEVFGAAAVAMGLIGLGFNVNMGAVFLLLLGLGLILAELHSHTFGIFALGGLICVIVGSILFVPTSFPQWYVPGSYQRSMALAIILPSLILGLFLGFAIYKVARARFAPVQNDRFLGEEAEALDRLDPEGYVIFQGEYWRAHAEEPVEKGERVVVVAKEGARLRVKRKLNV